MGYAMKTDRYRYVEWRRRTSGEILARELYDHRNDSQENINLAETAKPELLAEMSKKLSHSFGIN